MQINKDTYLDEILNNAGSVAVMIAPKGKEYVAAGVAMAMFIEKKYSKRVAVVYKGDSRDIDPSLAELHEILTEFGSKVLKLTINYGGTSIEAIDHYKEDDDKLVLEIKPVQRDFDVNSRIKYELEGGTYDVIVAIGVVDKNQFGKYYGSDIGIKGDFNIINIDNSHNNQNYGRINIVMPEVDSVVTLILNKFGEWGYTPDKEITKTLLLGLNT